MRGRKFPIEKVQRALRDLLDRSGEKPKPLAVSLGLGPTAIRDILLPKAKSVSTPTLKAIADHFDVTVEYLLSGGAAPAAEAPDTLDDIAVEHGFALLEELDLALGMGATFLDGRAEAVSLVPFKSDWLRGLHEGPLDRLKVVRGKGDSMEPTIHDGDIVLIDTAQRHLNDQDRIWAVAYGELGMIRRVRVTPRGSWLLMPDNQIVRPDEVGDGEVAVIGRVIWIGRRI